MVKHYLRYSVQEYTLYAGDLLTRKIETFCRARYITEQHGVISEVPLGNVLVDLDR